MHVSAHHSLSISIIFPHVDDRFIFCSVITTNVSLLCLSTCWHSTGMLSTASAAEFDSLCKVAPNRLEARTAKSHTKCSQLTEQRQGQRWVTNTFSWIVIQIPNHYQSMFEIRGNSNSNSLFNVHFYHAHKNYGNSFLAHRQPCWKCRMRH